MASPAIGRATSSAAEELVAEAAPTSGAAPIVGEAPIGKTVAITAVRTLCTDALTSGAGKPSIPRRPHDRRFRAPRLTRSRTSQRGQNARALRLPKKRSSPSLFRSLLASEPREPGGHLQPEAVDEALRAGAHVEGPVLRQRREVHGEAQRG